MILNFTFFDAFATNLQEAINEAQNNNRNIKLEKLKLKSTETLKSQAISEFLPNVSADAQYGNRNSHYRGQTYDRSSKQKVEEIKIEQPIFDGLHSVSKYYEATYKIKSSDAKTSDKIQEISFSTAQSYCNLFRYQELLKLQKENKDLGARFLDLAKRRKEAKIIDSSDIIKFSYEASINEEKYLDTLNKLNKAKFDYQNIVGILHEKIEEPKITEEDFDKEKVMETVLNNNFNIKSYHYNYLASKASYNAEKSNFSPKVSLSAQASKQSNVVYLNNRDLNSKSLFLNLSVPIFQKGAEYANLDKAKYEKEVALEEYEITKENLIKEISQSLEEYKFYSEINKSNKKLLDLAMERVEIYNKRLKSRVEDPIEVIRTKIEANNRAINYLESQMNLAITHYKIKYFLGTI